MITDPIGLYSVLLPLSIVPFIVSKTRVVKVKFDGLTLFRWLESFWKVAMRSRMTAAFQHYRQKASNYVLLIKPRELLAQFVFTTHRTCKDRHITNLRVMRKVCIFQVEIITWIWAKKSLNRQSFLFVIYLLLFLAILAYGGSQCNDAEYKLTNAVFLN